jgi:N-methylhydantoinase B
MARTFDPIELEVLWQSLIATVNEQARALQRAAFSPIVREAGDLANAVFDKRGRMVAQAVTGTPGHINSLARAVGAILDDYPISSLKPGDIIVTNDPYKTAGQLLDVTVMCPVWKNDEIIAFFGSTIHHTDVGGYGIGAGARDVFEEGLWIPICRLMIGGERNHDVWKFILSNVRQPDHMAGDLQAQMASGEVGARRLLALCEQHDLDDIEELSDEIITRSDAATRAAIRELPAGTYEASAELDLADGSRIHIACAITVDTDKGEILVDYEGSSGASPYGINVVRNYTHAYTTFAVRAVLNPDLPNNYGSLAPILVEAPVGSIVNAVSPQPCTARHVVGMFLPNALLKALAQIRLCRSAVPTTMAARSSHQCSPMPVVLVLALPRMVCRLVHIQLACQQFRWKLLKLRLPFVSSAKNCVSVRAVRATPWVDLVRPLSSRWMHLRVGNSML